MDKMTTERLAFRVPAVPDGDALYALMNDFDIIRFLTSVPWPYKRVDADAYIERTRTGRAEGLGYYFLVIEQASDAIVGTIDLRFDAGKMAHFGYWYAKSVWGRGYASEALLALLDFGFRTLGLENIWGAAMPENPASIRVMEKCGLRHAGMIEVSRPNFGDSVEMVKLDMQRTDWLARSCEVPA